MQKKKNFPHTYVIIFSIIFIATLLTWIVPAGSFQHVKDAATGKMIVVPDSFEFIKKSPVNPILIPLKIVQGMIKSSDIIFLVLIVGGCFNVIIKTEVFHALTSKITKLFSNKEFLIIPAFTTIFALACMGLGVNTFIGFTPIAIILAISLGYDAIVGVSMVALGGAIGFSTGTFNPFTTGVAQALAGLPLFSGAQYRFFSLIVFLIVTNIYIISYAKKVKKDPTASYLTDYKTFEDSKTDVEIGFSKRHLFIFILILISFALLIYGGAKLKWNLVESSALFIWLAIGSGLIYGFTPSEIAKNFIEGCKNLLFGALIIGIARSISLILADGKILDTAVYYLGNMLASLPRAIQGAGMFLMQLIINGLITSGSGQAAVTMPIMLPVADMVGMTRQTAILAFNFGDGLSNYVLPTSSALMGFLAIANISYETWMKFMWKLFLIWIVVGSILVMLANLIKLGPF